MKFTTTSDVRLRSAPGVDAPVIATIPTGLIVEGDEYSWKAVTLPDGKKGYCAADYLQMMPDTLPVPVVTGKWCAPIRTEKFKVTQKFLTPDPIYKITGHHPGTDYGTQGDVAVPLYFCADGEVIESGTHNAFGNYFFYYVPEVDRTFVYFHLKGAAPLKGKYKSGEQCGITGQTGMSKGVHLHLECIVGKKTSVDRARLFTSKDAMAAAAEDADTFIRSRLSNAK